MMAWIDDHDSKTHTVKKGWYRCNCNTQHQWGGTIKTYKHHMDWSDWYPKNNQSHERTGHCTSNGCSPCHNSCKHTKTETEPHGEWYWEGLIYKCGICHWPWTGPGSPSEKAKEQHEKCVEVEKFAGDSILNSGHTKTQAGECINQVDSGNDDYDEAERHEGIGDYYAKQASAEAQEAEDKDLSRNTGSPSGTFFNKSRNFSFYFYMIRNIFWYSDDPPKLLVEFNVLE